MIISKSIDAFDLLIKVAIEIIENEASNKKADFLLFCMLYNLLCYGIWFELKQQAASQQRGIIRAEDRVIEAGEGTIRAGKNI